MGAPQLDFFARQIEQAKRSAQSSHDANDVCSQHGRLVDLHLLHLEMAHMNLQETAELKVMMYGLVNKTTKEKGRPRSTLKEVSWSLKDGLHLRGYGAGAALVIIGLLIIMASVVGGMFIAG